MPATPRQWRIAVDILCRFISASFNERSYHLHVSIGGCSVQGCLSASADIPHKTLGRDSWDSHPIHVGTISNQALHNPSAFGSRCCLRNYLMKDGLSRRLV